MADSTPIHLLLVDDHTASGFLDEVAALPLELQA